MVTKLLMGRLICHIQFKHFLSSISIFWCSKGPLPSTLAPFLLLMCDYQRAALQSEIDRSADMYKLPLMMCLSGQIAGVSRRALHLQRSSGSSVLGDQPQIQANPLPLPPSLSAGGPPLAMPVPRCHQTVETEPPTIELPC